MKKNNKYQGWSEVSSNYIRNYSYENGDFIYEWMKRNGIGESDYGKYIDALGRKSGVFHHRLYGHHPIYDFPIVQPENIPDFLEHVLISDLFTRQGLPIIPGELLESTGLRELFNTNTLRWNFINGFDLLTASLGVYNSYKISSKFFKQEASIEKIDELAGLLGVSAIHVAIALSTFNPFLLISATISTAGAIVGLLNNPYKIYFKQLTNGYSVTMLVDSLNIDEVAKHYSIDTTIASYDLKSRDYI